MTTMNTTSIATSRRVPRINLGPIWLLGWLILAAWFGFGREWLKDNPAPAQAATSPRLSALTSKPKLEAVLISQMKVGDQVPADNPTGEKDNEFGDTVDPPNWRKLVLLAPKKDGSFADVELLRPLAWLQSQSAKVGGTVDIHVPECGIEGRAEVLAIEPCPTIKHDPRYRIVTGTFKHQASKVLEVYVEGLDEPIGTTPNHPFWSEDRQTFIRADNLKEGEHLRAFNGTPIVRRIVPLADPEPVFNLEVQCDHVYHVAKNGVLVHNSADCWTTFFHGTDIESMRYFLNGGYLDAATAAARKLDGKAGFFIADVYDDAVYYASRRSGNVLNVEMSAEAMRQLRQTGATFGPIGPLGNYGYHLGNELHIPTSAFDRFNTLLDQGLIRFTFSP